MPEEAPEGTKEAPRYELQWNALYHLDFCKSTYNRHSLGAVEEVTVGMTTSRQQRGHRLHADHLLKPCLALPCPPVESLAWVVCFKKATGLGQTLPSWAVLHIALWLQVC